MRSILLIMSIAAGSWMSVVSGGKNSGCDMFCNHTLVMYCRLMRPVPQMMHSMLGADVQWIVCCCEQLCSVLGRHAVVCCLPLQDRGEIVCSDAVSKSGGFAGMRDMYSSERRHRALSRLGAAVDCRGTNPLPKDTEVYLTRPAWLGKMHTTRYACERCQGKLNCAVAHRFDNFQGSFADQVNVKDVRQHLY